MSDGAIREAKTLRDLEVTEWTTAEVVAILKEKYAPTEVPPCRVCGSALSLQSIGGGEPTVWACSPYEADPTRPGNVRVAAGRKVVDEHYEQSRFVDFHCGGDERVLDLIRRHTEQGAWARRWKAWAKMMFHSWRRAVPDPEAVAAEARDVRLHRMGPSERGGFEIVLSSNRASMLIAQSFGDLLRRMGALNYVEQVLVEREGGARIVINVSRLMPGVKTPHELRQKAEKGRDALVVAAILYLQNDGALGTYSATEMLEAREKLTEAIVEAGGDLRPMTTEERIARMDARRAGVPQ